MDDLFNDESAMLKFPIIILLLSTAVFMAVSIYLIYWVFPMLDVC